ncbi:hypothetical protein BDR22DRAFT_822009 [Usnea florida]
MAVLAGSVLHERLLLSSLAEHTLNDRQSRLKDSHRVFFMTCCGRIATLHEMRLRNIWTLPNSSKWKGQPVAYDAIELAKLNMTKEVDCELLKQWLNAIHECGITIHYDSALEDDIAAAHRQARNPEVLRNLRRRASSYGKSQTSSNTTMGVPSLTTENQDESYAQCRTNAENELQTQGCQCEEEASDECAQGTKKAGQRSILRISTSGFSISFVKAKQAKGLSVTRVVVTGISLYGISMLCASQDTSSLLQNYLPSIAKSHHLDWFSSLLNAGERGATATLEARWAVSEAVAEGQTLWREAGFESREQYQMYYGFAKLLDEMLRSQDVRKPRAVSVDPDLGTGQGLDMLLDAWRGDEQENLEFRYGRGVHRLITRP